MAPEIPRREKVAVGGGVVGSAAAVLGLESADEVASSDELAVAVFGGVESVAGLADSSPFAGDWSEASVAERF